MLAAASSAYAFDAAQEAQNFSKITERERYITATPEFQTELQKQNVRDAVQYPKIIANDPSAELRGQHLRAPDERVRRRRPLLRLAEEGLRPHAPRPVHGARRRDALGHRLGDAIGPGDAAGRSSSPPARCRRRRRSTGAWRRLSPSTATSSSPTTSRARAARTPSAPAPDRQEGVPAQAGQPFYDGTEDALNFFFSNPKNPYVPQKSCGNANNGVGTSHAGKQKRRVPRASTRRTTRSGRCSTARGSGIAGHSLGASAVSYVGQIDPRVDAIVAWDNLSAPSGPPPARRAPRRGRQRADHEAGHRACRPTTSSSRSRTPRTPTRRPRTRASSPTRRPVSTRWRSIDPRRHPLRVLVPARQHGGLPFGTATLRGMDMVAWYSTAWFDRYVKCQGDPSCQQTPTAAC